MERATYDRCNTLLAPLDAFIGTDEELQCRLRKAFDLTNVSWETFRAIFYQRAQKRARRAGISYARLHLPEDHLWNTYRDAVIKGRQAEKDEYVLKVICIRELPLCQMARLTLRSFAAYANVAYQSSWFPEPDSIPTALSTRYREADRIAICQLARECAWAIAMDPIFAPSADAVRHSLGVDLEARLHTFLRDEKIAFWSESALKSRHYPKTPDALLLYPIAIECNGRWRTVCWFESKGVFGDPEYHEEYMRGQLVPYYNRFGPGAVIYWPGFLDEIAEKSARIESEVAILSAEPTSILRIVSGNKGM